MDDDFEAAFADELDALRELEEGKLYHRAQCTQYYRYEGGGG